MWSESAMVRISRSPYQITRICRLSGAMNSQNTIAVLLLCYYQVSAVGSQTVIIDPSSVVEVEKHEQIKFNCTYSGLNSVTSTQWFKGGLEVVLLNAGDCSVFSGTIDYSLYAVNCVDGFTWTILNVTESQDGDVWSCALNAVSSSATVTLSVQVCPSILDLVASSQVNTTDRSPGTVVVASCRTQVSDSVVTTCQSGGTWDPLPQNELDCGTTTTTSTATSTTTPTTTTTTATTTATTHLTTTTSTSTIPTTTTSTSTTPAATSTTTTTTSPTSTTTTTTTSTAATMSSVTTSQVSSATQTPASTPSGSTADSNKGLITMIIVVSVIGGILIIAIVFMVFLMVYWNDCLGLRSHGKHAHHKSYRPGKHHHHGHHKKYKTRMGQFDQSSYQMQNPLEGYSFYKGVRNPVFDEGAELPNVYYTDTGDIFMPLSMIIHHQDISMQAIGKY